MMRFIAHSSLLFIVVLILSACGGGGGGSGNGDPDPNPGNTEESFRLFPQGYFVAGYREEFDIEGENIFGEYEGTILTVTESEAIFNGSQAVPVRTFTDWHNKLDVEDAVALEGVDYFSTAEDDRRRLGNFFTTFLITAVANSNEVLPVTAKFGDEGTAGIFSDSVGETIEITWKLEDAGNNKAKLTWQSTSKFPDNSIHIISTTSYIIGKDGKRESLTINFDDRFLNVVTTWTGVRK